MGNILFYRYMEESDDTAVADGESGPKESSAVNYKETHSATTKDSSNISRIQLIMIFSKFS